MSEARAFLDTNVLLYLLSTDQEKADRAEECLARGGIVSVQVLNEFASVASRKLGMRWEEIRDCLGAVRSVCAVVPLSVETHDRALDIAQRHRVSFYDALIAAAACLANCKVLCSEDFQEGRVFEESLTVVNPFKSGSPGP